MEEEKDVNCKAEVFEVVEADFFLCFNYTKPFNYLCNILKGSESKNLKLRYAFAT